MPVRRRVTAVLIAVLAAMLPVPALGVAVGPARAGRVPVGRVAVHPVIGAATRGRLAGRVLSRGRPVAGATVRVHRRGAAGHRTMRTGAFGHFHLRLRAGRYRVRITAPGLRTTRLRVRVRAGRRTHRVVELAALPVTLTTLSGRVLDGSGHGWPLYAQVAVVGPGTHLRVWDDPVTGRWSVRVPQGAAYALSATVSGGGYQQLSVRVRVGATPAVRDLRVAVDPVECSVVAGYEAISGQFGPCRTVAGGLIVGRVTSGLSGVGLTSVLVAVVGGDQAYARPTEYAAAGTPGVYEVFSAPGTAELTYSRVTYGDARRTVAVGRDRITSLDVALAAGHLTVSPSRLTATSTSGDMPTATLTLRNDGTAAAHVTVSESRDGSGSSAAVAPGSWTDLPDLPVAVRGNATAVLDGVLYSVGGSVLVGGQRTLTTAVYAYRPGDPAWTTVADLPSPRTELAIGVAAGRLVVNGGTNADDQAGTSTFLYDPGTDTWGFGPGVGYETAYAGSAVLGDVLYLIGGCLDTDCLDSPDDSVHAYDVATDTMSTVASYPGGQDHPECGGIDGRIYCTGGDFSETDGHGQTPTSASYAYDPGADRWTSVTAPPVTVEGAQVAVANGRLVVTGGVQDGVRSDRTWSYDPGEDRWSSLPASGRSVADGGGACGLYRVGGVDPAGDRVATAQRLASYDGCDGGVDLPWLSVDPGTVTVPAHGTATVTVTVDPATLDPGTVTGGLRLTDDAPGALGRIPISVTVAR